MGEQKRRYRIFIVEDHPFIRDMLVEYLENEPDMDVSRVVPSAEEAIHQIEEAEPDLVLLDVALPGMSGIELIPIVRERWPGLPCLMLSGHEEVNYVRRALEAGARGYLLKGYPEELPYAVREVVAGHIYVSDHIPYLPPEE